MTMRSSAFVLVAGALFAAEAAAQTGQGAPIVFARRENAQPLRPTLAVETPAEAPARIQYAAATRAPAASAQPDEFYGYGGGRGRSAPTIDLRGALRDGGADGALGDDAFETASATPALAAPRVQPPPVQPTPASARPEWLETERTGAPYQAHGQWYVPTAEPGYAEAGTASWYGQDFHGRRTASGEVFDSEALTAAHPTLPIPSLVQVTNLENGREVIVRVNDRGPFHAGRLIDVSRRAAEVLGFEQQGQARVHVRYLGPAPKRVVADGAQAPAPPSPAATLPRPAPAAPAEADGAFVVQVGAFSDPANVARVRSALEPAGVVMVDVRDSGGRALHRVRLGAWRTRGEAEAARETVASLGFPGAVVAMR